MSLTKTANGKPEGRRVAQRRLAPFWQLYGCKGCMLLYNWGDEKITDYSLLTKSVLMTNSIYILALGPETEGKHFSCALCRVSTCGERGPLSEIYHTLVL
jgi:hypothetical protein